MNIKLGIEKQLNEDLRRERKKVKMLELRLKLLKWRKTKSARRS